MSKNEKVFMRKFARKLRKALELEATHCGFDAGVRDAVDAAIDLTEFVRAEIRRLSEKAGEP